MMFRSDSKIHIYFLSCFIVCSFFIALLFLSFTSHAAGTENDTYFPMSQNYNGHFSSTQLSTIENYFNSEDNYIFVRYQGTYSTYTGCFVLYYPKTNTNGVYGEIFSNGYQFSLYYSGSVTGVYLYNARLNNNGTVNLYNTTFAYAFQNLNSSLYDSNSDYVSNFKLYTTNNPDNQSVVLKYGADDPDLPDLTGHAVPPNFDDLNPVFNTGHSKPNSVPQFRGWTSYTWTTYTPPSFDDSSVINAIESIGDIIEYTGEYLVTNIGGAINNLGSNIKGFFEDLGNILIYYGGLIISNIQNAVTNLYDNFVSLFEPVTTFFNNLIYMGFDENGDFSIGTLLGNVFVYLFVPSAEDINGVLVENDQYGIISLSSQMTTMSINFIHHLNTDTAIYVIEIPQFSIYHQTLGPYYIDFQWYYDDYKFIGDPIISAFLVFGFFMWLYSRFPYWLRGQQGDITKAVTEVTKK